MVTQKLQLPPELVIGPFFRADLEASGLSSGQLRSKSIRKARMSGLYFSEGAALDEVGVIRAVCRKYPASWASHFSAARIHGLWIPDEQLREQIHMSTLKPQARIRRGGIVSHESRTATGVISMAGIRISEPGRAVREMARLLPIEDVVVLIDQLIRIPRNKFDGTSTPILALSQWKNELADIRGAGKTKLVNATKLARVGSDSRPETLLRLAIVRSGLPEPELQLTFAHLGIFGFSADMGYSELRIAIHYDGRDHRRADQQHSDNSRDYLLEREGWRNLRCSSKDLAEGFVTFCDRLRHLIAEQQAILKTSAPL